MDFRPEELPHGDVGKLINAAVVPRPIAWVSTRAVDGVLNLAPFSYFNAVCSNPPTIVFSAGVRVLKSTPTHKDTLTNIRETGEFVVNFVSEHNAVAMNLTSVEAPPHVDEFAHAGLTPVPGVVVNVPSVAESPIHFECRLNQIITISDQPGGAHLVIGTIVHMHFDDSIYRDGNYLDLAAYQPVGRTSGAGYVRVTDTFTLSRPPSEFDLG